MGQLLEGIHVIDLTNNLAGPSCAGALADFGAEVIHIEKPVLGDDCRKFPPMIDGQSLAAAWNNRGKKSLVLDLKDPEAIEVIKQLLKNADVLVESYRPGAMKRMGLDYEAVMEIREDIIYCSISAFGQKGPYSMRPGYDIIAQAYSGFMHLTGEADGPPMKSAMVMGDTVGALNAFGCIMAALYYREKSGIGQYIDVSLARGLLWCNNAFDRLAVGVNEMRAGNHDPALAPYGLFRCKNGENIIIAAVSTRTWENLCRAIGKEDLIKDARFQSNDLRAANQKELIPVIEEWLQKFDHAAEAAGILEKAGVPCIKVYDCQDIAEDLHAREAGWILNVKTPVDIHSTDEFLTRGVQADFSVTPGSVKPGPSLGQHNHEILEELGWSSEKIEKKESEWARRYGA